MLYKVGDKVQYLDSSYEFEVVHCSDKATYQYVLFSEGFALSERGHSGTRDGYLGNGRTCGHRFADDSVLTLISSSNKPKIELGSFVVKRIDNEDLVFEVVGFRQMGNAIIRRNGWNEGHNGIFIDSDYKGTESSNKDHWSLNPSDIKFLGKGMSVKVKNFTCGAAKEVKDQLDDFVVQCTDYVETGQVLIYSRKLSDMRKGHSDSGSGRGNGDDWGHWYEPYENLIVERTEIIKINNNDVQTVDSNQPQGRESGICRRKIQLASSGGLVGSKTTVGKRRIQGSKSEIRFSI